MEWITVPHISQPSVIRQFSTFAVSAIIEAGKRVIVILLVRTIDMYSRVCSRGGGFAIYEIHTIVVLGGNGIDIRGVGIDGHMVDRIFSDRDGHIRRLTRRKGYL